VFFCKHGTGISFFVKCGELLDNYYIFGDSHTHSGLVTVNVKVKQSLYKLGVAQRVPGN